MKSLFKKFVLLNFILTIVSFEVSAQCPGMTGGVTSIKSKDCQQNKIVYQATGMTTGPDVEYLWQRLNLNVIGAVWVNAGSNSDTLEAPANQHGFAYRLRVRCKLTPPIPDEFSTTIINRISTRKLSVEALACDSCFDVITPKVGGGFDTTIKCGMLKLKLKKDSTFNDDLFATNFTWNVSKNNGFTYSPITPYFINSKDSIFVPFESAMTIYAGYVSTCPQPNAIIDTSNKFWSNKVIVGLEEIKISLDETTKRCNTDSATLILTNVDTSLLSKLNIIWEVSANKNGPFQRLSHLGDSLKIKVNKDSFYRAKIAFCGNTDTTIVGPFELITQIKTTNHYVECPTEAVVIDYSDRLKIKDANIKVKWERKKGFSGNFLPYDDPQQDQLLKTQMLFNDTTIYRIVTMLCDNNPTSFDTILDTVILQTGTNNTTITPFTCPSDSITLTAGGNVPFFTNLNNIQSLWQIKTENDLAFRIIAPKREAQILKYKMPTGWTSYRKATIICPVESCEGGTSFAGAEAKSYLPNKIIGQITSCAADLILKALDDTVRFVDNNGEVKVAGPFTYQWQTSSQYQGPYTDVAAQIGKEMIVPPAGISNFYRRIVRLCPASINTYTSNISNITIPNPTSRNGKAQVFDEVCLDKTVEIGIVNEVPRVGTPTYMWQVSDDNIKFNTYFAAQTNNATTFARTLVQFKYYRRITLWCDDNSSLIAVDSSESVPLSYVQSLPWCDGFSNQVNFGENRLFSCFTHHKASCNTPSAKLPIYSNNRTGRQGPGYTHQNPVNPPGPSDKIADGKLVTPAFRLEKGKTYRFSFWHRESGAQFGWDSMYCVAGSINSACDLTEKIGHVNVNFRFDQWNRHHADFTPCSTDVYYFGIVYRETQATRGDMAFDDVCVKEVKRCDDNTPRNGSAFAPSKIIDRPEQKMDYEKYEVTHQYCIGDTIMITYEPSIFGAQTAAGTNQFDYSGMVYQFYRKRMDPDFNITDSVFTKMNDNSLFGEPNPLALNQYRIHINKRDWLTTNVVATDTNTYYKIVGTCLFDGKEYHSDSLLVNGTHSLPYCEDWSGVTVNNDQKPHFTTNEIEVQGGRFSPCPTCWGSYGLNGSRPFFSGNFSPWINGGNFVPGGGPLPLLGPYPEIIDGQMTDYKGGLVSGVINRDATLSIPDTNFKVLIFPAVRLHKKKHYLVSFQWADNTAKSFDASTTSVSNPQMIRKNSRDNSNTDSVFLMAVKGAQAIENPVNFTRAQRVSDVVRNISSVVNQVGKARYQYLSWIYSPPDTGTYSLAIAMKVGRQLDGEFHRVILDDFCIDTIPESLKEPDEFIADPCADSPVFKSPLYLNVIPDGVPYPFTNAPPSEKWCNGEDIAFALGIDHKLLKDIPIWKKGWRMQWEYTDNPNMLNWYPTSLGDTLNFIKIRLTTKYRNYRLRMYNDCGKGQIVGPLNVFPSGGNLPLQENFDIRQTSGFNVPCWTSFSTNINRLNIRDNDPNDFLRRPLSKKNSVEFDWKPTTPGNARPNEFTLKTPAINLKKDSTYRISFWYQDNGYSNTIDSLRIGWTYNANSFDINGPNRLVNILTGNNIVRDFQNGFYKYYTAEHKVAFSVNPPRTDSNFFYLIKMHDNEGNGNTYFYTTSIENVEVKPKYANDLVVISIDSPIIGCGSEANGLVKAQVMNLGSSTQSNFTVRASVNRGSASSAVYNGSLSSNQIGTIYIPNVDFDITTGSKYLSVWTDLASDQDRWDDTLTREVFDNKKPIKPTDTGDFFCINQDLSYKVNGNGLNVFWYQKEFDKYPFLVKDTIQIPNFRKDTAFFAATSCSYGDFMKPFNAASFSTTFGNENRGIAFDVNTHRDVRLRTVDVFAESQGNGVIRLVQYGRILYQTNASFTKSGLNRISLEWDIQPGTDYQLIYLGGAGSSRLLRSSVDDGYLGYRVDLSGACSNDGSVYSKSGVNGNTYNYFFNWQFWVESCESERVKVNLKLKPSPIVNLKDTFRICSKPDYYLEAPLPPTGDVFTYLWNKDNSIDRKVLVNQTFNYIVSVTNSVNCTTVDSTRIIVDPSPDLRLPDTVPFCKNVDTLTINSGLLKSQNSIVWSDGTNDSFMNIRIPGTYYVYAYNLVNFCPSYDTFAVRSVDPPVFTLGQDRVFCGDEFKLQPNISEVGKTFTFGGQKPISNIGTINTKGNHQYFLQVKDNATNCYFSDTIMANLVANPIVNLGKDTFLCGPSTFLVLGDKSYQNIPGFTYSWNTTSTQRNVIVSLPGTYILNVTNAFYGCKGSDTINVTRRTSPVFSFGNDVVLCANSYTINAPSNVTGLGFKYTWSNGQSTPSISVSQSGRYALTVDNGCGDVFSDFINVQLDKSDTGAIRKLFILPDTVFGCGKAELTAISDTIGAKIIWSTKDSINTILVDKSQSVSVSVFNTCGSFTKSTRVIMSSPPVANFTISKPIPDDDFFLLFNNTSSTDGKVMWYFGDGDSSSDYLTAHRYLVEGEYLVTLVVKNACGQASISKSTGLLKKFRDTSNSSISNIANSKTIGLYPNPADATTKLYASGITNGKYFITITNVLGQAILNQEVLVRNNRLDANIETKNFANGEYFVNVMDEKDISAIKKLLIIHK